MTAAGGRSPRELWAVCAGLLVAAAALAGSAALTWVTVLPPGRSPVPLAGSAVAPSVGGFALLAVAGVAGVVASAGVPRRLLGGLLLAAAAAVLLVAVPVLVGDPRDAVPVAAESTGAAPSGIVLAGQPAQASAAPLLAVLAALVLAASGLVVAVREARLPRFGARYATGRSRAAADPDRLAWQDLDRGRDPTVDGGPGATAPRGDDP